MFNVGGPEIALVILVALVVLGPEQLPKAMRTFGNVMGEVRKLSSGFQSEMRDAMKSVELDGLASSSDSRSTSSSSPSSTDADRVEEVVARNDGTGSAADPPGSEGNGQQSTGSGGPSAADRAAG